MHSSIRETNSSDQTGKKQKNGQEFVYYNANAIFLLTAFIFGKKLEIKAPPSLM